MSKRLFVGTLLTHEQADLLSRLRDELEPQLSKWWHCKLRWVKPEKLHTTWLFMGNCDKHAEKNAANKLQELVKELHSTELHFDSLKVFPKSSHPVALVLLPTTIPEGVHQIFSAIKKELGQYCEKLEERTFSPHLTLLRFPKDLREKLACKDELDLSAYLPMTQKFNNLSLIESHLGQAKDGYEVLADYSLS